MLGEVRGFCNCVEQLLWRVLFSSVFSVCFWGGFLAEIGVKSFQNNLKISIEKNTIFNSVFFIIWNAQIMKILDLVEAKRYILQNRRFRKKYENDLPKHPPNPSKIK